MISMDDARDDKGNLWGLGSGSALFDTVFYDVTALSEEEQGVLIAGEQPEGGMLVLFPSKGGKGFRPTTVESFMAAGQMCEGVKVTAFTVSGVGSSDLGAAALARNVANYLGKPVAAIVAGHGTSDLLAEAMGGWFVLGMRNRLRYFTQMLKDTGFMPGMGEHVQIEGRGAFQHLLDGSPDSRALLQLLWRGGMEADLLVGHSKGNFSIEIALEGLLRRYAEREEPFPDKLRKLPIVTLGAAIYFPDAFSRVRQVIGTSDWFGMINSTYVHGTIPVVNALHSLNTALPNHLSVADALHRAGIPRGK